MDRLDLGALDSFAAIARHGSFRRAAVERGVSASTLSQALRNLEATLGVRLLNRTTRSVALTDAGAVLLASLQPALAQIASAVDEARSAQAAPSGALRINAPEPAIELIIAPLAAEFLRAYPAPVLIPTSGTSAMLVSWSAITDRMCRRISDSAAAPSRCTIAS